MPAKRKRSARVVKAPTDWAEDKVMAVVDGFLDYFGIQDADAVADEFAQKRAGLARRESSMRRAYRGLGEAVAKQVEVGLLAGAVDPDMFRRAILGQSVGGTLLDAAEDAFEDFTGLGTGDQPFGSPVRTPGILGGDGRLTLDDLARWVGDAAIRGGSSGG